MLRPPFLQFPLLPRLPPARRLLARNRTDATAVFPRGCLLLLSLVRLTALLVSRDELRETSNARNARHFITDASCSPASPARRTLSPSDILASAPLRAGWCVHDVRYARFPQPCHNQFSGSTPSPASANSSHSGRFAPDPTPSPAHNGPQTNGTRPPANAPSLENCESLQV